MKLDASFISTGSKSMSPFYQHFVQFEFIFNAISIHSNSVPVHNAAHATTAKLWRVKFDRICIAIKEMEIGPRAWQSCTLAHYPIHEKCSNFPEEQSTYTP